MSASNRSAAIAELRVQNLEPFVEPLVQVPVDSTLPKIIGALKELGVYQVFIPEGNRCGMISARDLLKAPILETTKPSALMVYVPILRAEATIGEAARLMADYRIRALPVSEGQKISGQINSARILRDLKGRLNNDVRISSIATKNPVVIEPEAPIAKARDMMTRKRFDHLPVVSNGKLQGIVTSSHLASLLSPQERVGSKSMTPEHRAVLDYPVRDVMERNPLTCAPESGLQQALGSILDNSTTYVLVTQWEELQAISTHRDFMALLADPETQVDVPIFLVGLPEDPFEAEATKTKFKRTVAQLHRVFPDMLEARSIIKTKFTKPGKERGRYEVSVHIRTPKESFSYSEEGWELPVIYDRITDRLKRLMTQKHGRRREKAREERAP